MTTRDERTRALISADAFLKALLSPRATARVPKEVRDSARRVLRHFPSLYEFQELVEAEARHVPEVMQRFDVDVLKKESERREKIRMQEVEYMRSKIDCLTAKGTLPQKSS